MTNTTRSHFLAASPKAAAEPGDAHSKPRPPRGGLIALTLLLAGWILGMGCSSSSDEPLRIGINAWPTYELIYLAQEKGFFRDAGVKVRLVEFGSLSNARRSYEAGKIDGLATTIIEVLMARDVSPRDLRIVSVIDFSSGADVIVAGTGKRSMAELRGARVGVELASLGIYVLARALELEGLTLMDVKPVSKDQKSMRTALFSGELDAAVTYPPESAAMLRDPRFGVLFSTRKIPGEVVDVVALDGGVLQHRPAQAAAFLKSLERAYDFLQQHPEEACHIMGGREGLSGPAFRSLLSDGITLVAPGEQAAYFRENSGLSRVIDNVARTLRDTRLISSRPGVSDCLAMP